MPTCNEAEPGLDIQGEAHDWVLRHYPEYNYYSDERLRWSYRWNAALNLVGATYWWASSVGLHSLQNRTSVEWEAQALALGTFLAFAMILGRLLVALRIAAASLDASYDWAHLRKLHEDAFGTPPLKSARESSDSDRSACD